MVKILCPQCGCSANLLGHAQAIGTATGVTAGAVGVLAGILARTQTVASAVRCLGISGAAIGSAANVVISLLAAASFGGVTGAQAGKLVDEHLISIYKCPKCGTQFKR